MKRLFFVLFSACLSLALFAQEDNLSKAKQAYENGNYIETISLATAHLKKQSKDVEALMLRSKAYAKQEEYKLALADATKAIQVWNKDSKVEEYEVYLCRVYLYVELDEREKAINDLNTMVSKDKNNPIVYEQRALVYSYLTDYAHAETDYRKAAELAPDSSKYQIEIARMLLQQEKYTEGEQLLREITKYEPNLQEAQRLLALSYFYQDRNKEFIERYFVYLEISKKFNFDVLRYVVEQEYPLLIRTTSQKITLAKDNGDKYFWLYLRADIYIWKEQYQDAIADLNAMQGIMGDRYNPYVTEKLAHCYDESYDYLSAIASYTKLIQNSSSDNDKLASYFYSRGICYLNTLSLERAMSDFGETIQRNAYLAPYAYYSRAYCHEMNKNYDEALEDYNRSILFNDNIASVYCWRGRLLKFHKNDTAQANKDFQRVLELDTIPTEGSRRQFALCYLGRTQEAEQWQNQILEADPSVGNYYDAACFYSRMNNTKKAVQYLQKAVDLGYKDFALMETDEDLDNIRQTPEYLSIVESHRKGKINQFNSLFKK